MATFKTTNKDFTETELIISGARATASNLDVASTVYGNYDNDTSNTYRLAEIAVRDNYGSTASNGFGNMIFRTNGTGGTGCNLQDRIVITHDGRVGINTINPQYTLEVDGAVNVSNLFVKGQVVNSGRQPTIQGFTPISVTESNVYTSVVPFIINPQASGIPTSITVSSYLLPKSGENVASSNFTYQLRAYDSTRNVVLGTQTRSNELRTPSTFTLSNVYAANTTTIELQAKKNNGGLYMIIDAVNIGFD